MDEQTEIDSARRHLETVHGQVWNTSELQEAFEVIGFSAPYVIVTRKADRTKGTLQFQHSPRFYWGFVADRP